MALTDLLGEDFWARHTNPWSGYTRLPMGPVLLLGLYRRDWRMVGLTLLYVLLNPILFPEPESKDAWISRSVLGEQLWLEDGHEVFEANLPGLLNGLNAIAYCYGLYGAYKHNPRVTALGSGIALSCKLVYLDVLVRYYDEHAPVED
ncbi:hypothetical protein SAMN05216559_3402 [Halomicrobium zhouii]|uniref:Uncharacterized protein n=1 Tax=Halomicrobium zhouii TaxID=767519 RepID=A0A1I6LY09_9EURY|nr:DUF6653 family protein [Halomicrobium zhouii]SFS08320.1 hypothetical protein SAMN05216559_3402 [Halomicrobium zhouii]